MTYKDLYMPIYLGTWIHYSSCTLMYLQSTFKCSAEEPIGRVTVLIMLHHFLLLYLASICEEVKRCAQDHQPLL